MPIFEYRCTKCGKTFEELVVSSSQEVTCPDCGQGEPEKLMSCCRHKTAGGAAPSLGAAPSAPSSSGSSCAGCAGGNCSTCH